MSNSRYPPGTGVIGMFDSADALKEAVREARRSGYDRLRVYSPFPIDGMDELLSLKASPVRWWVLAGAVAGAVLGYAMQWYSAVVDYPFLAGNRPLHSWPAFIPVTFELLVLGGATAGFIAVFFHSRLPRLHHPVFDVEQFELESGSRFFLLIAGDDRSPELEATRRVLERMQARNVREVQL